MYFHCDDCTKRRQFLLISTQLLNKKKREQCPRRPQQVGLFQFSNINSSAGCPKNRRSNEVKFP